ncbi:MAG: helix-turn-helix domain-containing protein [Candidatus Kapaibacterium sp.]
MDEFALYSPRQVARMLKVSDETVRKWIDDGTMPHANVGRHKRINRLHLEEWHKRATAAAESQDSSGLAEIGEPPPLNIREIFDC